ncbi:MAG: hypothetical protein ACRD0U_19350, partial [Acidimicrobiales bacterium]
HEGAAQLREHEGTTGETLSKRHRGLDQQRHPGRPCRDLKPFGPRRQRQPLPFREHQVRCVIGGKAVTAPRGQDALEIGWCRLDRDREFAEQVNEAS